MPRKQRNQKSLPIIWRVPHDLRSVTERVLAELYLLTRTGRKWIVTRSAPDATI